MRVAALAAATLSRHISSVYDGSDCPERSFTSRESEERVKASYGDNDEHLATIKGKDDPTNFFRVNQNIKPAQEGESSMAIFQKKSFNSRFAHFLEQKLNSIPRLWDKAEKTFRVVSVSVPS